MTWVLGILGVALLAHIWLSIRVGRSSTVLAILTFLLGPVASLYTLVRHRRDAEASVTVPFVVSVVFWGAFGAVIWQVILPALAEQERAFQASLAPTSNAPQTSLRDVRSAQPPRERAADTTGVIRVAMAPAAQLAAPAATPAAVPAAVAASAPPASENAMATESAAGLFSVALREAGLEHTLGKVISPAQLPPGVARATQLSVAADGRGVYPVTLFECESTVACRHLAGQQMHRPDERRRVLQNGLLLLSTPAVAVNERDLTLAAVASVFRKLPT